MLCSYQSPTSLSISHYEPPVLRGKKNKTRKLPTTTVPRHAASHATTADFEWAYLRWRRQELPNWYVAFPLFNYYLHERQTPVTSRGGQNSKTGGLMMLTMI